MKYVNTLLIQLVAISSLYAMDKESEDQKDHHLAHARDILAKCQIDVRKYPTIIDVGCRTGKTTAYMYTLSDPEKNTVILGIDPSVSLISGALERCLKADEEKLFMKLSRLSLSADSSFFTIQPPSSPNQEQKQKLSLYFSVTNLDSIPKATKYHLVTSFNSAQLAQKKHEFLSSLSGLLHQEGTLLMTTKIRCAKTLRLMRLLNSLVKEPEWEKQFTDFDIDLEYYPFSSHVDIFKDMENISVKDVKLSITRYSLETVEEVSKYFQDELIIFSHFRRLKNEDKIKFCNQLAQRYSITDVEFQNKIELPDTIVVRATKDEYSVFSGKDWVSFIPI